MEQKYIVIFFAIIISLLIVINIMLIVYIVLDVSYYYEVYFRARRPDPLERAKLGPSGSLGHIHKY